MPSTLELPVYRIGEFVNTWSKTSTWKTWNAKKLEIKRNWWIVDATDKTVGRLAVQIAGILRGKHKPQFTPNQDTGDFVVVINAEKVKFTGNKLIEKNYYRHSRYFGSLKSLNASEKFEQDPTFVLREAVEGMLPKNKLSRDLIAKLKTYKGSEHPHTAQRPTTLTTEF